MKLAVFLGLLSLAFAKDTYFGDQVLTLYPKNEAQAQVIRNLDFADFWSPDSPSGVRPDHPVDLRIPSAHRPAFNVLMHRNRIDFEVKIDDVQTLVDNQIGSKMRGLLDGGAYNYNVYHTYDEIAQWVVDITKEHSNIASKMVLGTSFEGREIPMIKISTDDRNPALLVDCGFHAREWISPAFCQCYANHLLEGFKTGDSTITQTLNDLTIYIVPSVNVDGYAFTWSDDRMWRKTRSTGNSPVCVGVDPNRNCDAGFGGEGSSPNPCSDVYYGPYAESEPEVKALADFVRANVGNLKAYVTFHAYGQMILYPYSYTYDLATTHDQLGYYSVQAQTAIKQKYRTRYVEGPGAPTIYPAAGGSDDFSYDAGVALSYTIELRDKGAYGFLLPEDQIAPVCEETFDLMEVMHQGALDVANNIVKP